MGKFYEQFLKRESVNGMIFDVDGTILDSMPVWAHSGERYLKTLGICAPVSLGKELFSMTMQKGAQYIKQTYQLTETAEQIQAGIIGVVEDAYRNEVGFKPSAKEFLMKLHAAGIPMTIVTTNDRPLVEAAFERLQIRLYFQEIITCGEFGSGKDHPDIFYEAAKRMGSSISNIWVAEDGLYAMRTAKKEGFRIIGMADMSSRDDEAQIRQLADYFLTDYADDVTNL